MRALDIGSNPLAPQGKAGSCEFPLDCAGSVIYGECGSGYPTYFNVGIFSFIQCVGVTQLVSGPV